MQKTFTLLFAITLCVSIAGAQQITQLQAADCGKSNVNLTYLLKANTVQGASEYEFRLENQSLNYTASVTKTNNNFALTDLASPVKYNTQYEVKVRTKQGGALSAYGPTCNITTAPEPVSKLLAVDCGASNVDPVQSIKAEVVPNANQYDFEVKKNSFSYTEVISKNTAQFKMAELAGPLDYNTTYEVRVRTRVGGVLSEFGPSCNITSKPEPVTQLVNNDCGAAGVDKTQLLKANAVPNADQYEFKIENTALGYSEMLVKNTNQFRLNELSGSIQACTPYEVRMRMKTASFQSSYGPACIITTKPETPVISAIGSTTFCQGGSVTLTSSSTSGSAMYYWSTGETTQSIVVAVSGTYIVTVTEGNGCQSPSAPVSVTVNSLPVANAGPDQTINEGASVQIGSTPTADKTYYWTPATGLSDASISNPLASPAENTTYSLFVTDANGCQSNDEVTVSVCALYLCIDFTNFQTTPAHTNTFCQWDNGCIPICPTQCLLFFIPSEACDNNLNNHTFEISPTASGSIYYEPYSGLEFYQICFPSPGDYNVRVVDNDYPNITSGWISVCVLSPVSPTPPAPITATPNPFCFINGDPFCSGYVRFNYPVCPEGFTGFCNGSGCINPGGDGEWARPGGGPIDPYTWMYFTPGTYTATLDCYSSGICWGQQLTTSTTVEVIETTLSISATPGTVCENKPVDFTVAGCTNQNSDYYWNFGDGNNSTQLNVSHSYTAGGTYTVTFTLNGCLTLTTTVVVLPEPTVILPGNALICNSLSTVVNANFSGGTNLGYSWSPSSGVSPANGITSGGSVPFTFSNSTNTLYTLTVSNGGCVTTKTIFIKSSRTLSVNAGTDKVICNSGAAGLGSGTLFNCTSATGGASPYSYNWTVSPSNAQQYLSTTNTCLAIFNFANNAPGGVYSITLTVTDANGCTKSDNATVTIYDLNFTLPATDLICNATSKVVMATLPQGGNYSYSWSPSAGVSPSSGTTSGGNVAFTFTNTANTTYSLTVNNGLCTVTKSILVKYSPELNVNAGPDEYNLCSGTPVNLGGTPTSSGGISPYTYSWTVTPSGGSLSSSTASNPVFNYSGGTQTFTASVTVTDANGCTKTDQKYFTLKSDGECCAEATAYTYKSIQVKMIGTNEMAVCTLMNGTTNTLLASDLFIGNMMFSVKEDITIFSPVQLSMSELTIKFGPNGRIVVRKGSRLNLNRANTLTSIDCPTVMWQGIYVEGTSNSSQTQQNQGWLWINPYYIPNRIMNAHYGVRNFYGNFFTSSGGIIQAEGAEFINNNCALYLLNYYGTNTQSTATYFKKCLFETNSFLKDNIVYPVPNNSQNSFAILWNMGYKPGTGSSRILFECNIFRNTTPKNNFLNRGAGIKSADAQYDVIKGTCKGGNYFSQLNAGIDDSRTLNSSVQNDVNVLTNTFSDNLYGIIFTGTGYGRATVEDNKFLQSAVVAPGQYSPVTYGIYGKGGGNINIFKNILEKHTVGCFIDNSGTAGFTSSVQNNNAWKNTFTNCGRGLEFKQNNSRFQVLCNTFNNGLNVAQAYWVVNNGNVKSPQGGGSNPCKFAANIFGTPTPPKKDISLRRTIPNFDPSFTYYYDGNAPLVSTNDCNPYLCLNMQLSTCIGAKVSACNSQPQKASGNPNQIAQQLGSATTQEERMQLIEEMLDALVNNNQEDDIIPFLENTSDVESKWRLVPEYIAVKRYNDAETLLNTLQKDNLEKQKKDEYLKVQIELGKTDRIPTDMNTIEKATVETVAISETEVSNNAKAMLHFWFKEKYEPELAVLDEPVARLAANEDQGESQPVIIAVDSKDNKVSSIYPNPNGGRMKIDYQLMEKEGELLIFDLTGRMIRQLSLPREKTSLDIDLTQGVYFYTVNLNGATIFSEKLVVIE